MPNKCEICGKEKAWIFFGREGSRRVCDCQVDLSNVTQFPWGMSSFLDECMGNMADVLKGEFHEQT